MKRRIMLFRETVSKDAGNEDYFISILYMAQRDGLIDGLTFKTAWGKSRILLSELSEAEITPKGIEYLTENSMMQKVGNALRESVDTIDQLASIINI